MSRSDVLLDQIKALRLGEGLSQRDLETPDVREPLTRFAADFADCFAALIDQLPQDGRHAAWEAAKALKRTAGSRSAGESGGLDRAFARLDRALDLASTAQGRLPLLERLVASMQAARLLLVLHPAALPEEPQPQPTDSSAEPMQLDSPPLDDVEAADASQNLRAIASLLGGDPSGHQQLAAPLLASVQQQLTSAMQALPPSFFAPLLPPGSLAEEQAHVLEELAADLAKEYTVRRQMLIERAKVLMQSFMWADRLKDADAAAEARAVGDKYMAAMQPEPAVSLAQVFEICQGDLVSISNKATSGDKSKFGSSVKSLVIGAVPDRGGRASQAGAATAKAGGWKDAKRKGRPAH